MKDPCGHVQIILCTPSASMGVNFENTRDMMHFSPPHGMDTYVQ